MRIKHMPYLIGGISLLICLLTWAMDWLHWVEPCVYCRTERTIIGVLGVLILLPIIPHLTRYLSYVFGFFGAYVASAQIFLTISKYEISMFVVFAACALFIIIAQVFYIGYLDLQKMLDSEK